MKLIPTLALLLLTALPTYARLGETKAQCETRYGKPVGTTKSGNTRYLKGGLEIVILYWKDKAAYIYFAKAKPGAPELDTNDPGWEKRDDLSENEMDVLLKANATESKWEKKPADDDDDDISWIREDITAAALYIEKCLFLRDLDAVDAMDEEQDKKEAAKIKDFGGLGETRAECDKRYGKPIDIDGDEIDYKKDGLVILVTLWNGKAAAIIFSKAVPDDSDTTDSLSDAEQAVLLQANAGGLTWKQDEEDIEIGRYAWDRSDGKARAIYDIGKAYLLISTTDYLDHIEKEGEKKETKDLEGF